jgi:hypothetical protein
LHAEDKIRETGEIRHDDFCFMEMYCCLIGLFFFWQLEAKEGPEGDGADKDVDIIGDDGQMETEVTKRHAEAVMPKTEVPAADIPDKAEIPRQPKV